MKKNIFIFSLFFIAQVVFAATKTIRLPSVDSDIPEEELVKVVLTKLVDIRQIDEYKNPYFTNKYSKEPVFDKSLNDFLKVRSVYLLPGEHTFHFLYRTNVSFATGVDFTVTLEKGKTYELIATKDEDYDAVYYDIQDAETHTTIIPGTRLTYRQQLGLQYTAVVLRYINDGNTLVLNGTMPKPNAYRGKSVKEITSNFKTPAYDYIIEYGSDMTVKYTEKGKVYEGFIGYDVNNAVIYIKFNKDGTLTKEDFLNLKPEECDRSFNLKKIVGMDKMISISVSPKKGKQIDFIGVKK